MFFLIWGSFLNMLAYRLVSNDSLLIARSFCPNCKNSLYWYDNIPLFSWLWLKGSCRFCNNRISLLYPAIELLTLILMSLLIIYIPHDYFVAYFIFFSALIVSIRTDLQCMLISRFVSLYLIPIGFLCSYFAMLPINLQDSLIGTVSAYCFLFGIAQLFHLIRKTEGMGQGDIELLAFIGSFLGPIGWWATILIGSLGGSVLGILYCSVLKSYKNVKIPFGPFLALGALLYTFFSAQINALLLPSS